MIPFLNADQDVDLADASMPECMLSHKAHVPRVESYLLINGLIDDPEAAHGMPCSIQLITRSQHDEELMAVTQIVSDALKANSNPVSSK